MSVPTHGEAFSKLLYHIREAQSAAAMMSHLHKTEQTTKDDLLARGWIKVSEHLKQFAEVVIQIAKGRLN